MSHADTDVAKDAERKKETFAQIKFTFGDDITKAFYMVQAIRAKGYVKGTFGREYRSRKEVTALVTCKTRPESSSKNSKAHDSSTLHHFGFLHIIFNITSIFCLKDIQRGELGNEEAHILIKLAAWMLSWEILCLETCSNWACVIWSFTGLLEVQNWRWKLSHRADASGLTCKPSVAAYIFLVLLATTQFHRSS